jgi:hypothetical protein
MIRRITRIKGGNRCPIRLSWSERRKRESKTPQEFISSGLPKRVVERWMLDMFDNGVDICTVAAMAGHSSASTTQKYDRRGDEAK